MQAYLVTLALFLLGWRTGAFSPARVYELFGEILSALNLFSLAFCCLLYVKARTGFARSECLGRWQASFLGGWVSQLGWLHVCRAGLMCVL